MNFREFEHAGWEKLPQRYHQAFGGLTSQTIEPLLDAVGVDFATSMVAEARRRYPEVTFRDGDAEELPFPDATFDAVTMSFGLMHLARPERAIGEAHRVLRSGGRFGFTVWASPEQARGFAIVFAAIQKHGDLNVPIPSGPPFFRFSDAAESKRVLRDAGFAEPQAKTVQQVWRLGARTALWEFMSGGTVRTAALLHAQTLRALEAIRAEVIGSSSDELPMPALLAYARKN